MKRSLTLRLSDEFIAAVLDQQKVIGTPHGIYRYPARFSPAFARAAILAFTEPGDLVLDPFCGGGTSVAEAIAVGRRAAGIDISSLAAFLTRTKTTPLSIHDAQEIREWAARAAAYSRGAATKSIFRTRYRRNVPRNLLEFFDRVLSQLAALRNTRQRNFVRLVLLDTGQWALDCKAEVPTSQQVRDEFQKRLGSTLEQFRAFLTGAAALHKVPRCQLARMRRVVARSCAGSEIDNRIPNRWLPAKLVLTSPPYAGVHVLYHRWQIQCRRESPLPFWIANQNDGSGESHYTFGSRSQIGLKTYFATLLSTFASIRKLVDEDSLIVQLVGFSHPEWQFPKYLEKMEEAGFREVTTECNKRYLFQGRIWRSVPSRRWYATNSTAKSSHEVLLFHRIR